MYDNIALLLALGPIVLLPFWFLAILTAPAALFMAIRYWRAPSSVAPRTKARFVTAGILALLEIAGVVAMISFIVLAQIRRLS